MHPQVSRDLGDRAPRLEHEPHAAIDQLLWALDGDLRYRT
jgi:hypothetical protein